MIFLQSSHLNANTVLELSTAPLERQVLPLPKEESDATSCFFSVYGSIDTDELAKIAASITKK